MSFHNNQGMDNIIPIAESLSRDGENEITLLDLRSIYSQSSSEIKIFNNISIVKEKSIFKNIRSLNKLSKLLLLFTKFFAIKKQIQFSQNGSLVKKLLIKIFSYF